MDPIPFVVLDKRLSIELRQVIAVRGDQMAGIEDIAADLIRLPGDDGLHENVLSFSASVHMQSPITLRAKTVLPAPINVIFMPESSL